MFFTVLDALAWPLSGLSLVYSVRLWRRGSYLARDGRRISRQARPGMFWFEVVGGGVLALMLAAAGWTHWFALWAR
ncbi:hypothetical protein [Ralstonia pseudosolanacearum]|uniref:hypothetical protein n=1 Tax=Ralstonia pseudosolanacearum TaxID=1310165 RepID=UPI0008DA8D88|nr:hypothetical protein [Ralstonia pseudosolanacearum]MCL1622609.1 hypothetical protein [Ralstonia pseudosolanacearum CaRs-Mep]